MAGRQNVTKIVLTTKDGKEHTFEGEGVASIVKTTKHVPGDPKTPVGWVEVTMPVATEWATGEDGRYLRTPGVTL